MKVFPAILFIPILTLGFICNEDKSSDSADDTLEDLEQLIIDEIGQASAADVSECRSIAFGSKPCGGPWSYLVYSTSESDEDRLIDLVGSYNDLEKQVNEAEGRASDCSFVSKPELDFDNGRCIAAN